jgi:hypothetical protein
LENTWFPRVTEAPDEADDDGCAAGDPAAAGITLETSAAADATTVGVVLEAVDAGFDAVDAELAGVDAPVAVPVV